MSHLRDLLSEYGKKSGLGPLEMDARGVATLEFNDRYLVAFEEALGSKGMFLYAVLCSIPIGDEEIFSIQALEANLFGKETGRSSIGYDSKTRSLILFDYLDYEGLDFNHFLERLQSFCAYLEYWQHKDLSQGTVAVPRLFSSQTPPDAFAE